MRILLVSYIKWTGRFFMRKKKRHRHHEQKNSFTKKINTILSLLCLAIFLPVLLTILYQKMQLEELLGNNTLTAIEQISTEQPEGENATELIQPGTETISQVEKENAEKRLPGIVAKEISISAPDACIKAQSIIARTNLFAAMEDGTSEPAGMSIEELRELWGDNFQTIYERLEQLCTETEGKTLQYQNRYIYAAYHAISAGTTRNMSELYAEADMPYLSGVACHEDTTASEYLTVNYWEMDPFLEKCRQSFPDAGIESMESIQTKTKDSAGYVLEMQLGQTTCTGEEFRNLLGLPSAHFSITEIDGSVRIVTMGLGHGLGLSQYTAEKMAEAGEEYEKILEYFYPGVSIAE